MVASEPHGGVRQPRKLGAGARDGAGAGGVEASRQHQVNVGIRGGSGVSRTLRDRALEGRMSGDQKE